MERARNDPLKEGGNAGLVSMRYDHNMLNLTLLGKRRLIFIDKPSSLDEYFRLEYQKWSKLNLCGSHFLANLQLRRLFSLRN